MGKLIGSSGQYNGSEYMFDLSGTITSGGTAQLLLPKSFSRSSLIIQNLHATANMYLEIGAARATATLTNGVVTSCSVTNAGMGYSLPPRVHFYGGQNTSQTMPAYTLAALPDWPSPSAPASAHCVMTGTAPNMTVSSIVIEGGGANYACPPYVWLRNDPRDPFGSAVPSTTSGIELVAAGGSYTSNGTICTTDQIAIFCATSTAPFVCKFSI